MNRKFYQVIGRRVDEETGAEESVSLHRYTPLAARHAEYRLVDYGFTVATFDRYEVSAEARS